MFECGGGGGRWGGVKEQTHFFERSLGGLVTFREICSHFLRNPGGDGQVTTFV